MFKKAKINKDIYNNNNYNKATYTGISKILYTINHKLLDFGIKKIYNEHVLEIGGGAEPHIKYMDVSKITQKPNLRKDIITISKPEEKVEEVADKLRGERLRETKQEYTTVLAKRTERILITFSLILVPP